MKPGGHGRLSLLVVLGSPLLSACGARGPGVPGSAPGEALVVPIASASTRAEAPRPPPRQRREVRRVGQDIYEVPEALFHRLLRERGAVDRRVWTETVTEKGQIVGYRLEGIRADSIAAQLGLQNEDLIELINGALPDSEAALEGARASAERTGLVTVLLTRLGSSRIVQYRLAEE